MKNIKILTSCTEDFIVPAGAFKHISTSDGTQLKVLLYCLAKKEFEISEATEFLSISQSDFEKAMEFWVEKEIIAKDEKSVQKRKASDLIQTYDSETLATAIETEPSFASLKISVEDMIGKVLNKNDISLLYYMYHFADLDPIFICTVGAYAVARGKGNMRYISQTAITLYDEGIDTFEKLETHLAVKQKGEDMRSKFISLCGFGSRKLSSKEEAYISKWFTEYDLPFDVVKTAYEKTVDSIGKINLQYIDSILTAWYTTGIKSAEDAKQASAKKKNGDVPEDSFDVSQFVEAALKKGVV